MFSVLVIRLRSLRLLRVSGIVMRLRMFLLLITLLKASHSFMNRLLVICKNAYLFFFSSRRRHTRSKRDWSSDVCSSDLDEAPAGDLVTDQLDRERFPLRDALHLGGDGALAGEMHLREAGHTELPSPVRTGSGSKGVISARAFMNSRRAPLSWVNLTWRRLRHT